MYSNEKEMDISLVSAIACPVITAISFFLINNYYNEKNTLKRNNKKINYDLIEDTRSIKYKKVSKTKICDEGIQNRINIFYDVLNKEVPNFDLSFFGNNILDLTFKTKEKIKGTTVGFYDASDNKMHMQENYLNIIYHELFHLASSNERNGIVYSGFKQFNREKRNIGVGLNEGYTDLLSYRYFSKYNYNFSNCYNYKICVYYSRLLETIVGRDKMQQLYSKGDLKGLINELELYSNKSEILDFIKNLDLIFLYFYNKNIKTDTFNYLQNSFEDCSLFLIKCYCNKSIINGIYDNLLNDRVNSFIDLLNYKIYDNKNNCYNLINVPKLRKSLDQFDCPVYKKEEKALAL